MPDSWHEQPVTGRPTGAADRVLDLDRSRVGARRQTNSPSPTERPHAYDRMMDTHESPDGDRPRRPSKTPGYGWNPRLSGLDRPREWLGFVLTVAAVLLGAIVIAFVAFG